MTEEQKFQTPPLPPQAPAFGPGLGANSANPNREENSAAEQDPQNEVMKKLKAISGQPKMLAAVVGGSLLAGILLGAMLFGGGSSQAPAAQGLMGVVNNPDIRGSLPRCGLVAESAPCAVFLMNHSRNDRYAEYFFDEAVRQTGRQKYLVTIENQHYAKSRIPPGHIARIKIPPLR